jgi:transposase-like protein
MEDGRCRLGPGGRLELVRLIEQGSSLRAAAAALNVAPATAHRWWHRWRQGQRAGAGIEGVSARTGSDPQVVPVAALGRG